MHARPARVWQTMLLLVLSLFHACSAEWDTSDADLFRYGSGIFLDDIALSNDGNTMARIVTVTEYDHPDYEQSNVSVWTRARASEEWAQEWEIRAGMWARSLSLSGDGKALAFASAIPIPPNVPWSSAAMEVGIHRRDEQGVWSPVSHVNPGIPSNGIITHTSCTMIYDSIGGTTENPECGEGTSISLSDDGSTLAIFSSGNDNYVSKGRTRIYTWDGSDYTMLHNYIDGEAGDAFKLQGLYKNGHIELSGDGKVVAISSSDHDSDRGVVRVYDRGISKWEPRQELEGRNPDQDYYPNGYVETHLGFFGYSMSLSTNGSIVAVGTPEHEPHADKDYYNNAQPTGHVDVYQWQDTTWIQQGTSITGEDVWDAVGASVSLSGDGYTLAIGSPGVDSPQNEGFYGDDMGHVGIYAWDGTTWNLEKAIDDQLPSWINSGGANNATRIHNRGTLVALAKNGHTLAYMKKFYARGTTDYNTYQQIGYISHYAVRVYNLPHCHKDSFWVLGAGTSGGAVCAPRVSLIKALIRHDADEVSAAWQALSNQCPSAKA